MEHWNLAKVTKTGVNASSSIKSTIDSLMVDLIVLYPYIYQLWRLAEFQCSTLWHKKKCVRKTQHFALISHVQWIYTSLRKHACLQNQQKNSAVLSAQILVVDIADYQVYTNVSLEIFCSLNPIWVRLLAYEVVHRDPWHNRAVDCPNLCMSEVNVTAFQM